MGQLPQGPLWVFACQWGCPHTPSQSTRGQGCPCPFSPNALLTPARDPQPHHRTQSCWEMLSPGRGTWPPPAPGDSQGHHFLPAGSRLAARSHPSELGLRTKPLAAHGGWGAGGSDLMGPLPLLMGPPHPWEGSGWGVQTPSPAHLPLHPLCPPQGPQPHSTQTTGGHGCLPMSRVIAHSTGETEAGEAPEPPCPLPPPPEPGPPPCTDRPPPPTRAVGTHTHIGASLIIGHGCGAASPWAGRPPGPARARRCC